ncbi:hypothetical protein T492DRAFT_917379 [Pavlovales sp. CCMP2436]|nr:hypothetical protein T492DRAFT_917379 [Pavlovales sp. CCMP2436]
MCALRGHAKVIISRVRMENVGGGGTAHFGADDDGTETRRIVGVAGFAPSGAGSSALRRDRVVRQRGRRERATEVLTPGGCMHAPEAAEYCTLVGGASDVDSDGDASLPSAEPPRPFPCDEAGCDGERPYACDELGCEYLAALATNLKRHKRTHSGERPYAFDEPGCEYRACDVPGCEYRANEAHNLKLHKRTHSGEQPFPCDEPGCKNRAAHAGYLEAHKRKHCGERPAKTGPLTRATSWRTSARTAASGRSRSGALARHKHTHSSELPFACDEPECDHRAARASLLTAHTRTHSGEQPFACDEPGCAYRAAELGNLTRHKRTHSGERPFACDEPGCKYRATTAGHLTAHKRTHSFN